MQNIHIEDLPEAVASGKLTKEKASLIIWEEIYKNPKVFGLYNFTEDQKSDFLLEMHKHFEELFEKFIPGNIPFKNFITGCLSNYKLQFLKKQVQKEAERRSIDTFLRTKTEEDIQKYNNIILEDNFSSLNEKKSRTFSKLEKNKRNSYDKRDKRSAELTTLILMMKACKDIDDNTIDAVSSFTEIDRNLLCEKIQELKESISRKNETNLKLIKKRNNAFFFHRKYMQEMTCTTNERLLESLKERYEKQTEKWKAHNERLSVRSTKPSNEEIARIIGIKPRMVSFYINHANREKTQEKIHKLYMKERDKEKSEIAEEEKKQ
jgi:hypothetical protein